VRTSTHRLVSGSALAALVVLAALAAASTACSTEAPPEVPDSGPHPRPPEGPLVGYGRCEDGMLYHLIVPVAPGSDQPPHGAGAALGRCPGACRSAVVECTDAACSNAPAALCEAPPARGKRCDLEGTSCSGTGTVDCPEVTACNGTVTGSTCTCDGSSYACTPAPELAAVHASLVGKWRGTVSPPEFSEPYGVSLWIYPDGTYWSACTTPEPCMAFYYGSDGPHPGRRITVAGALPAGAHAAIGQFGGTPAGELSSLVVAGDTLTFTYKATWHRCDQPFSFTLARE